MSGFLLDTNVISELRKSKPEPKVVRWISAIDEELLFLSVLTVGEIRKGINLHPDYARRVAIQAFLSSDIMERFSGRILPISTAIADRWGVLTAAAKTKNNYTLPVIDGLLAATAQHYNLTFITRNTKDVALTGVPYFNPWL